MKKLLSIAIIGLAALSAQADTTNVTLTVKTDIVVSGVTNSTTATTKLVQGSTVADTRKIAGLSLAYETATAGQIQKDSFPVWLEAWLHTNPVNTARDNYLASVPEAKANKIKSAWVAGTLTQAQQDALDAIYATIAGN